MKLKDINGMTSLALCAVCAMALTSCVIDDLHYTSHPEQGALEVTADFSGRSSDSQLPDIYTLRVGDMEEGVSGTTNIFGRLLDPADYTLLVYNEPYGITVSGTTASVETYADGTLNCSLGSLFSGTQRISVPADDTLRVTQAMAQRTRTLILRLNLSEEDKARLVSFSASLTGIAAYADIATGEIDIDYSGTIAPALELKSSTAADGGTQWYIEARAVLLGIAENASQILSITVTLDDGHTATIDDDISDDVDGFNDDEGGSKPPFDIGADITLPVEAGATGSIGDWTVVDNGNVDIH